jgi:DNA-binding Lrp family transcriptional regulator
MDLRASDFKVLTYLIGVLDYENYLCISQQAVGEELGLSRQQVSASAKRLVEKGVLLRGEPIGNQNTYRVNNKFFEKGKKTTVAKAIKSIKKEEK